MDTFIFLTQKKGDERMRSKIKMDEKRVERKTVYHYFDSPKHKYTLNKGTVEAIRTLGRMYTLPNVNHENRIRIRMCIYGIIVDAINAKGMATTGRDGIELDGALVRYFDKGIELVF